MARIAFCWELGQGLGRLAPHLELIRHLTARGDEVFFLAKETRTALEVFDGLPVKVIDLIPGITPPAERIVGADSYPEVLHNCGFHAANLLHQRVGALVATLADIGPDVLIADFAPTVMLANVGLRLPIIAAGNGFQIPVRSTPMPRFRYWQGGASEALARNEALVLDTINEVLARMGWPGLHSIAALLQVDCEWLRMFSELDFYGARDGANYLGSFPIAGFGVAPVWPSTDGARAFAYLAPGSAAMATLRALPELGVAVCLFAPKLAPNDKKELDPVLAACRTHDDSDGVQSVGVGMGCVGAGHERYRGCIKQEKKSAVSSLNRWPRRATSPSGGCSTPSSPATIHLERLRGHAAGTAASPWPI